MYFKLDLYSKEVWYFGYFMCKIISWLENSVSNVAILTTVAISVERCLAILYPLKLKAWLTNKRIILVVLIIWISSTIFSIPLIKASTYFKAYHREFDKNVSVCYLSINNTFFIYYLFISLGLFYLLPCIVLFVLYLKIVCVLSKRNKSQNLISESEEIELNHSKNRNDINYSGSNANLHKINTNNISNTQMPKINANQIVILLIIMMLLVFICLLPIRVFTVWFALADKQQRKKLGMINYSIILTFCRVMFYLNSVLNPIFYHFMSTKFQNAFKNFFFKTTNNNGGISARSRSTSKVVLYNIQHESLALNHKNNNK